MQERERILELVKKGVISTEEALILLENVAQKQDERQIKQAADKVNKDKIDPQMTSQEAKESDEELEERLGKILEKANEASVKLDAVNEDISKLNAQIKTEEEKKQTYDTMEELGTLTESRQQEEKVIVENLNGLYEKRHALLDEKETFENILKESQKERFQAKKEEFTKKMEIPEDWKEQTQEAFNDMGSKMQEAGNHLGGILKKTFSTMADAISENVDWKDVNLKVPGLASTKFQHTFNYPDSKATLIDVKLANGAVVILPNETDENVRVEADVKLYGKMEDKTPLEVLLEKSQIEVDDELISFQLPNKRMKADLTFYLPKRVYDHMSLKLLNGDIEVKDFNGKDIYAKSTNGDLSFSNIDASMLELSGVNGDIEVQNSQLRDLSIDTVNGDMTIRYVSGNTVALSGVNGDIRTTLGDGDWQSIEATNMNGTIKVAIPADVSLKGELKTSAGSVKEKLSQIEVINQRGDNRNRRYLDFERQIEDKPMAFLKASTSTGDIYVKDTDQ